MLRNERSEEQRMRAYPDRRLMTWRPRAHGVGAFAALILATAVPCSRPLNAQVPQPADLVLVNGTVLTLDVHDAVAQAIAVRHDSIVAVGSSADILRFKGPDTRVIDLHGRTATPGLIDTHGHFADGGVAKLFQLDLGDASSVADVVQRVKARAVTLKPSVWILGQGWDEGKLTERRYVYARDLDAVSPKNPVWLVQTTGHYGVANSEALRLAGITRATANPEAGTIDREAHGDPTGVLKESAQDLVGKLVPPQTLEQTKQAVLAAVDELHREGMTAVKEGDVQPLVWDAYRSLLDEGKLHERVFALFHAGTTIATAHAALDRLLTLPRPPASLGDGFLFAGGAKMYMDGSGGARTAWLYQPWHKGSTGIDSGNYGYPTTDTAIYRQQVRLFHQAGIHVGTHAIGDRAIDFVVNTYADVLREKPTIGLRHAIIHANIPTDHAIETMHELEAKYDAAYPESQAPFTWWIGDTYAGNFGPERAQRLNPFHTYLSRGMHWGGGSDYPVTPLAARYGIWASIAREPLKGVYGTHPFGTAESVDVHAALRSYTSWAARQLFLENQVGTLEVGKRADIAVWDRDPYTVPTAALKDMKCELTILNGVVVWTAETR
jgi:predicted amidohydrolase YtcJ